MAIQDEKLKIDLKSFDKKLRKRLKNMIWSSLKVDQILSNKQIQDTDLNEIYQFSLQWSTFHLIKDCMIDASLRYVERSNGHSR